MASTDFEKSTEDLIAFADSVEHGDDELFDRVVALVRRDPDAAFETGQLLIASASADRREMGIRFIGVAGVAEDYRLREAAKPLLREALRRETAAGPIGWAILELGHLGDQEATAIAIPHAHHPDPEVRESLAASLPTMSCRQDGSHPAEVLVVLRQLMSDEDGDVRDWATFGIGQQDDTDDEVTRAALLAHVDDKHEDARMEAIIGLARRHDERVRPYLMRQLAEPNHFTGYDAALEVLDGGTNWLIE